MALVTFCLLCFLLLSVTSIPSNSTTNADVARELLIEDCEPSNKCHDNNVMIDNNGDVILNELRQYRSTSNFNNNRSPLHKSDVWETLPLPSQSSTSVLNRTERRGYYEPNCATLAPNIAYSYLNLFINFVKDGLLLPEPKLSRQGDTGLANYAIDSRGKVYILELGANSGKFCYHFLNALQTRKTYLPVGFSYEQVVYILTDKSSDHISRILGEKSLRPFFLSGKLIAVQWDPTGTTVGSGNSFSGSKASIISQLKDSNNPLFVISNFYLSKLKWDIFQLSRGILHEGLVSSSINNSTDKVIDLEPLSPRSHYYSSDSNRAVEGLIDTDLQYLDQLLLEKRMNSLGAASAIEFIGIPVGALQVLRSLYNLTNGGNFLLTYIDITTTTSKIKRYDSKNKTSLSLDLFYTSSFSHTLPVLQLDLERFVASLGGGSLKPKSTRAYEKSNNGNCNPGSLFLFTNPINDSKSQSSTQLSDLNDEYYENFVKFSPNDLEYHYESTYKVLINNKIENAALFRYLLLSLRFFRLDADLFMAAMPHLLDMDLLDLPIDDQSDLVYLFFQVYPNAYFESSKIDIARTVDKFMQINNQKDLGLQKLASIFDSHIFEGENPLFLNINSSLTDKRDLSLIQRYYERVGYLDRGLLHFEEIIMKKGNLLNESLELWHGIVDKENKYAFNSRFRSIGGLDSWDSVEVHTKSRIENDKYDDNDIEEEHFLSVHSIDDDNRFSYLKCCSVSSQELLSCTKSINYNAPSSSSSRVATAVVIDTNQLFTRHSTRIAVMTYSDASKYLKHAIVVNGEYCRRRGYHFVVPPPVDGSVLSGKDQRWSKVYLLKKFMESRRNMLNIDYVMWIDPDFIFTDFESSLESIIVQLVDDPQLIISADATDNDTKMSSLNTASFIFKMSDFSLDFLKEWWGSSKEENMRNIKRFKFRRGDQGKLNNIYLKYANKIAVLDPNAMGTSARDYNENISTSLNLRGESISFKSKVFSTAYSNLCSIYESHSQSTTHDQNDNAADRNSSRRSSCSKYIIKRADLHTFGIETYEQEVNRRQIIFDGIEKVNSSIRLRADDIGETDALLSKFCIFNSLNPDLVSSAAQKNKNISCESLLLSEYWLLKSYQKRLNIVIDKNENTIGMLKLLDSNPELPTLLTKLVEIVVRTFHFSTISDATKLQLTNEALLDYDSLIKVSETIPHDRASIILLIYTSMMKSINLLVDTKKYDRAWLFLDQVIKFSVENEFVLHCSKKVGANIYQIYLLILQQKDLNNFQRIISAVNDDLLACIKSVGSEESKRVARIPPQYVFTRNLSRPMYIVGKNSISVLEPYLLDQYHLNIAQSLQRQLTLLNTTCFKHLPNYASCLKNSSASKAVVLDKEKSFMMSTSDAHFLDFTKKTIEKLVNLKCT